MSRTDIRRYLNKSRVGIHEQVREPSRGVDSINEGIDVVILNKITSPCTQQMDRTRYYWIGLFFSYQIYYFCLILPVVSKLLSQWNGILQNQKVLFLGGVALLESCMISVRDLDPFSYIELSCGVR